MPVCKRFTQIEPIRLGTCLPANKSYARGTSCDSAAHAESVGGGVCVCVSVTAYTGCHHDGNGRVMKRSDAAEASEESRG